MLVQSCFRGGGISPSVKMQTSHASKAMLCSNRWSLDSKPLQPSTNGAMLMPRGHENGGGQGCQTASSTETDIPTHSARRGRDTRMTLTPIAPDLRPSYTNRLGLEAEHTFGSNRWTQNPRYPFGAPRRACAGQGQGGGENVRDSNLVADHALEAVIDEGPRHGL